MRYAPMGWKPSLVLLMTVVGVRPAPCAGGEVRSSDNGIRSSEETPSQPPRMAGKQPLHSKGRRCVSPWIVYRGEDTIDRLRKHADIVASISVCGNAPAEFIARCRELEIVTYKLVGGKHTAFDTAPHRKATIAKYLTLCQEVGYDGIDLDFEMLDATYREAYSALLREASRELHRAGKKLSMCVSYMMSTRRTTEGDHMPDFYDHTVVGQTCDMVRVMCYDMYSLSGKGIGPVSTQPWAKDAVKYWLRHVPAERLVMGLPAYSGDFEMKLDGKRTRHYSAPRPVVPMGTTVRRVWLPYEQINTYKYVDAKGVLHLFYASDAAGTRAHLETAERLGVFGIAFWHYAAVTPPMWQAVREWHAGGVEGMSRRPWLVFP